MSSQQHLIVVFSKYILLYCQYTRTTNGLCFAQPWRTWFSQLLMVLNIGSKLFIYVWNFLDPTNYTTLIKPSHRKNEYEWVSPQTVPSNSLNGRGTVFTALNLPTLLRCSFSNLHIQIAIRYKAKPSPPQMLWKRFCWPNQAWEL